MGSTSEQLLINPSRRKTDKWFSNFQKLLVKYNLLGRENDDRLKVAILDSGFDLSYSDFSDEDRSRIKEKTSFVDGDSENTIDAPAGHGTHIAAIILRLTKNVDLYIGKITNSSKVSQREEVARVTRHFHY